MAVVVVPQTWIVKRGQCWCDRCMTSAGYYLEQVRADATGLTTLSQVVKCHRCDDGE
jgi:hypothetical protein